MAGPVSTDVTSLPVYPYLDEITSTLLSRKTLAVRAGTGAGKSTLVPWHLLSRGILGPARILMLEPRRVAARAVAERIAFLLGEKPGGRVGYRTRTETLVGKDTILEIVTEGVFVRIIQDSGYLQGYGLVIFDEFHERTLPGDLAWALVHDCREKLCPDLCILVMTATMPEEMMSPARGLALIDIPGRTFPVAVDYRPRKGERILHHHVARCVGEALERSGGDVLVFLPGYGEIGRAADALAGAGCNVPVSVLHGTMAPAEQHRVLSPSTERRIILATNVAETSLTIPGVTVVVDSGLVRNVRFSPRTGMDHRDTVRISLASAAQRAGRAGRTGPGLCLRLWDESESLEAFSPPAILTGDLAPLVLECALWGTAPRDLPWITSPPEAALNAADRLLESLGLVGGQGITDTGRRAASTGLHPRLGSMMVRAAGRGWISAAALVAALVEEGEGSAAGTVLFDDGVASWMEWVSRGRRGGGVMSHVDLEMRRILRAMGCPETAGVDRVDGSLVGLLLSWAFPDRVARRSGDDRWVLSMGRGARMTGSFPGAEFCVITDMDGGMSEGRIFRASPVSRSDAEALFAGEAVQVCEISWQGWVPRATDVLKAGGLVLRERPAPSVDPAALRDSVMRRLAREGLESLPWSDAARRFVARCRLLARRELITGIDFTAQGLTSGVEGWLLPFARTGGGPVFDEGILMSALEYRLGYDNLPLLRTMAPEFIVLPSGTRKGVDYESGDIPVLAARLQEFFGCGSTPLVAGEPVLLHLLSPAGRPVQITRDLAGFWERSYRDVRKELMGRYPRHHWPDDPMKAEATSRAKARKPDR